VLEVLRLIQASKTLMYTFLREFKGKERMHKVLLFSDDVAERYYPFWASRMIDAKEEIIEAIDPKALDRVIGDTCVGLLRVGVTLREMSKPEAKKAFEEFGDRFRKDLPLPALVSGIVATKEVINVEEVLETFEGVFNLALESGMTKLNTDLVWPSAKPITV
jgi:hypothetical protein